MAKENEAPLQSTPDQIQSIDPDHFIDPRHDEDLQICKKKGLVAFSTYGGVHNRKRPEIKTNYTQTSAEKVFDGPTNSYIILGNDRNAGPASGLGGIGQTGCAAIDLIAGHMGARPLDIVNGKKVGSSKNFDEDAARIFISQKSKIDEYFSIPKYPVVLGTVKLDPEDSTARSAIGAKADCIRIVGRETIKLVTTHLGTNSLKTDVIKGGIDIIAGYDTPDDQLLPQPMVKGDNLIELLQEIISLIENTQATVTNFMEIQGKINNEISKHVHQTGAAGAATSAMIENKCIPLNFELVTKTLPQVITNFTKMAATTTEYFTFSSKKYINSRYNRVN